MMVYLWDPPADYPSWARCEYDGDVSADKYSLVDGISPQSGERLVLRCDVTQRRIATWDSIPNSSSLPLVSQRMANILLEHAEHCIELLEPEIECSDGMLEGYSLVLVKYRVQCVDLEQSEPEYMTDGVTIGGYKMLGDGSKDGDYRVKYDEEKLVGYPLARDADFEPHILVSSSLAEVLAATSFKGLDLVNVSARRA